MALNEKVTKKGDGLYHVEVDGTLVGVVKRTYDRGYTDWEVDGQSGRYDTRNAAVAAVMGPLVQKAQEAAAEAKRQAREQEKADRMARWTNEQRSCAEILRQTKSRHEREMRGRYERMIESFERLAREFRQRLDQPERHSATDLAYYAIHDVEWAVANLNLDSLAKDAAESERTRMALKLVEEADADPVKAMEMSW